MVDRTDKRSNDRGNCLASSSPNDAFVAFEHVQKSYDGVSLVVKDLNLAIGKG